MHTQKKVDNVIMYSRKKNKYSNVIVNEYFVNTKKRYQHLPQWLVIITMLGNFRRPAFFYRAQKLKFLHVNHILGRGLSPLSRPLLPWSAWFCSRSWLCCLRLLRPRHLGGHRPPEHRGFRFDKRYIIDTDPCNVCETFYVGFFLLNWVRKKHKGMLSQDDSSNRKASASSASSDSESSSIVVAQSDGWAAAAETALPGVSITRSDPPAWGSLYNLYILDFSKKMYVGFL